MNHTFKVNWDAVVVLFTLAAFSFAALRMVGDEPSGEPHTLMSALTAIALQSILVHCAYRWGKRS